MMNASKLIDLDARKDEMMECVVEEQLGNEDDASFSSRIERERHGMGRYGMVDAVTVVVKGDGYFLFANGLKVV